MYFTTVVPIQANNLSSVCTTRLCSHTQYHKTERLLLATQEYDYDFCGGLAGLSGTVKC